MASLKVTNAQSKQRSLSLCTTCRAQDRWFAVVKREYLNCDAHFILYFYLWKCMLCFSTPAWVRPATIWRWDQAVALYTCSPAMQRGTFCYWFQVIWDVKQPFVSDTVKRSAVCQSRWSRARRVLQPSCLYQQARSIWRLVRFVWFTDSQTMPCLRRQKEELNLVALPLVTKPALCHYWAKRTFEQ